MIGSASASPAETTRTAVMRASPNARARILQVIPPNAQIDLESCGRYWCYASWRGIFGYVSARSIINLAQEAPSIIYEEPYWEPNYNYGLWPYYGLGLGSGLYGGYYYRNHFHNGGRNFGRTHNFGGAHNFGGVHNFPGRGHTGTFRGGHRGGDIFIPRGRH
eukprot:gene11891-11983_t